jgi:dynactin 1
MAEPLQLNDAVHVTRDVRQLEGVISFLGSVSFADGDDWVGVRLTGASIGMGKNDGSVQDASYFMCPQNCGMFVRQAAVTKRSLTRLEELRLRRELASSSTGTTAPAPVATTASTVSKLEALRLRRAALAEKKEGAVAAAAAATTTRTPAPSVDTASESVESSAVKPSPSRLTSTSTTTAQPPPQQPNLQPALDKLQVQVQELTGKLRAKEQDAASLQQMQPVLDKLQVQVQELTGKLRSKEQDAASLQQKLSQAEQEVHDARAQVMELEESAATAVIAASTSAPAEPVAAVPLTEITNDHIQEQLQEAFEEISNLKRSAERDQETNDMLSQELQEVRSNAKRELEREKEALVLQTDQLTRARSEVTTLQKEMQATSDQTVQRGTSDALHYKERAKLQAEISALKRKAEEAEKEKLDLDAAVEEVTLDKEQLQEEKEALEDRLEELKLDTETAQI